MRNPLRTSGGARRVAVAAGITALIAGTLTTGAALPATATCTPTWKIVNQPLVANAGITDVDVLSARDARFTVNFTNAGIGLLSWNGNAITADGPQIPTPPAEWMIDLGAGSYDSAASGWVKIDRNNDDGDPANPLARWDGSRWTWTPTAASSTPATSKVTLKDVASVTPNLAWAVGAAGQDGAVIERWDGTEWTIVADQPAHGRQHAGLLRVTATSATDAWAIGRQYSSGGFWLPLALHYDGTAWREVALPDIAAPHAWATAIYAGAPDDVWIAAWHGDYAGDHTLVILHWDGQRWTTMTGIDDRADGSEITNLYASGPNDVWAVTFGTLTTGWAVRHWDGTTWKDVVPQGAQPRDVSYQFRAVDGTGPNDVWLVGSSVYGEPSELPGYQRAVLSPLAAHLSCGGK